VVGVIVGWVGDCGYSAGFMGLVGRLGGVSGLLMCVGVCWLKGFRLLVVGVKCVDRVSCSGWVELWRGWTVGGCVGSCYVWMCVR